MFEDTTSGGSDLGGIIAGLASLLSAVGKGYGSIQQMNAQRTAVAEQQKAFQEQEALYQKQAAQTPKNIMDAIMALKQPMSEEMKASIMRDIGNSMAASGAFSSPGIIQEAIAEALAKQDTALFTEAVQAYYANQAATQRAVPNIPPIPYIQGGTVTSAPGDALTNYFQSTQGQNLLNGLFKSSPPATSQVSGGFSSNPETPA